MKAVISVMNHEIRKGLCKYTIFGKIMGNHSNYQLAKRRSHHSNSPKNLISSKSPMKIPFVNFIVLVLKHCAALIGK